AVADRMRRQPPRPSCPGSASGRRGSGQLRQPGGTGPRKRAATGTTIQTGAGPASFARLAGRPCHSPVLAVQLTPSAAAGLLDPEVEMPPPPGRRTLPRPARPNRWNSDSAPGLAAAPARDPGGNARASKPIQQAATGNLSTASVHVLREPDPESRTARWR